MGPSEFAELSKLHRCFSEIEFDKQASATRGENCFENEKPTSQGSSAVGS
jgi:hypothetical protein